ncbi:hypothetical protein [Paraburkholderia dinghuensis]|uniref:Uncharacterized protein n=1 Tax=Paraburkholderia dinghuensis TaxID=2305225 RepID=A0A3N6M6D3_9BURK|nr:hypothetical protein [Paraburkholderia dinghuensis]RQG99138.1 hypothetical protein D1Y85_26695 [Paraburkholderia dinghuensis]
MVYVFFCVSGALGALEPHSPSMQHDGEVEVSRSLCRDVLLLERILNGYRGVVIVIGNALRFHYDLEAMRRASGQLGRRVVNITDIFCTTEELAVLDFMSTRSDPYVILASLDLVFSEHTVAHRVDLDAERGFDVETLAEFEMHLQAHGAHATRPPSDEEMLIATVGSDALRRAKSFVSRVRAPEESNYQRALRSLVDLVGTD